MIEIKEVSSIKVNNSFKPKIDFTCSIDIEKVLDLIAEIGEDQVYKMIGSYILKCCSKSK